VRILAACSPGEVRVAAWGRQGLVDAAIWRPGSPDGVGDVHRGRIGKVVPAMAGAFVALADGDGFLPDSAGGKGTGEGDVVAVRVVRAAQGGKGPRLARAAADPGAGPPALLERGPGAVRELAALHEGAEVVVDSPGLAAMLRPWLGERLRIGPAFDDVVRGAFEALGEPAAELPGGARMRVQPTAALTAIDIDLAGATAARGAKGGVQLAGNRALLPALAGQIRLRNLSGAILVDFGGMAARRRAALAPELAAALAEDPLKPRLLGFTALGLAEIVRPRVHPPLAELLAGPLAAGLAALRHAAAQAAARPGRALALRAPPAIITALRTDAAGLEAFACGAGRPIALVEMRDAAPAAWNVEERDG
jgi:hypothetical protein